MLSTLRSTLTTLLLMCCCSVGLPAQWTVLPTPNPSANLYSIRFLDPTYGFVCGDTLNRSTGIRYGVLYATTNGGINWSLVNLPGSTALPALNDVFFTTNGNLGVVVGDATGSGAYVAVSTNNGTSWAQRNVPSTVWNTGGDIHSTFFLDSVNGFVVGKASGSGNGPRIARTTNAGLSWVNVPQSLSPANNLYDLDFFDTQHGVAVGTGNLSRKSGTSNGGSTWDTSGTMGIITSNASGSPVSISMYGVNAVRNTSVAFAAGGYNIPSLPPTFPVVRRSTDYGVTWLPTGMNGPAGSYGPQQGFTFVASDILSLSPGYALISAPNGTVYRSTDTGNSWSAMSLPSSVGSSSLRKFSLLTDSLIHLSGYNGIVLRMEATPEIASIDTLRFGTVLRGLAPVTSLLPLKDTGTRILRIDSARLVQPLAPGVLFSIPSQFLPRSLQILQRDSMPITVTASAGAALGTYTGSVLINSNDGNYRGNEKMLRIPLLVSVGASALTRNLAINTNVGGIRIGGAVSKTLRLDSIAQNTGTVNVRIDSVKLQRGTDFIPLILPANGTILAPGKYLTPVRTDFVPLTPCDRYDTLLIYSDAPNSPLRIPITGQGLEPWFATNPADTLDLSGTPIGVPISGVLKLQNQKSGGCLDTTLVTKFRITGPNAADFSTSFVIGAGKLIPPNGEINVPITATPSAAGMRVAYAITEHEILGLTPDTVVLLVNGLKQELTTVRNEIVWDTTMVNTPHDTIVTRFLRNLGTADVKIIGANIVGVDGFYFTYKSPQPQFNLPVNSTQDLTLTFTPNAARRFEAELQLTTEIPSTIHVKLVGIGAAPHIGARRSEVVFEPTVVNLCSDTLLKRFIYNTGSVPLHITKASIGPSGASPNDSTAFSIVTPTTPPDIIVKPHDSAAITLRFCPKRAGYHEAELRLVSDADSPTMLPVTLRGNGNAALFVQIDTILFAPLRVMTTRDSTVSQFIRNSTAGTLVIDSITITGSDQSSFRLMSSQAFQVQANSTEQIQLRFEPKRRGFHQAIMNVYSSLGKKSLLIYGTAIYPILYIAPDSSTSLRVRVGTTRQVKIAIRNGGDDSSRVESVTIAGAGFSNASTGSLPALLMPNQSVVINVDFTPLHLCDHPVSVIVRGDGVAGIYAIADSIVSMNGVGIAPMVGSRRSEIDWGQRAVSSVNDSVMSDFLWNNDQTGTVTNCMDDTRIDSMTITGQAAADFSLLAPSNPLSQRTFNAGTLQPFTVRFLPTANGPREAYLNIYYDGSKDSVYRIRLFGGNGLRNVFETLTQIDWKKRPSASVNDSTALLLNVTNASVTDPTKIDTIRVDSTVIVSGATYFSVLRSPNTRIEPNSRDSVSFRFTPNGAGIRTGRARIFYRTSAVRDSMDVGLLGEGEPGGFYNVRATLGQAITGRPGDTIHVPVILSGDVETARFSALDLSLGFRKTMLKPLSVTGASGTLSPLDNSKTVNGQTTVRITSASPFTTGTIANVDFSVMLGDSLGTEISFLGIAVPNRTDIGFTTDSVRFTIEEFCDAQTRLVQFGNLLKLSAAPNPAGAIVRLSFSLPAITPTQLGVYDATGREVARLHDQVMQPGTYSVVFDASGLASGLYYCTLTAGNFSRSIILKIE